MKVMCKPPRLRWWGLAFYEIYKQHGQWGVNFPVQVPKMLGCLRLQWAPEAFVVSFKLETDKDILLSKVSIAPSRWPRGANAIQQPGGLPVRRPQCEQQCFATKICPCICHTMYYSYR